MTEAANIAAGRVDTPIEDATGMTADDKEQAMLELQLEEINMRERYEQQKIDIKKRMLQLKKVRRE